MSKTKVKITSRSWLFGRSAKIHTSGRNKAEINATNMAHWNNRFLFSVRHLGAAFFLTAWKPSRALMQPPQHGIRSKNSGWPGLAFGLPSAKSPRRGESELYLRPRVASEARRPSVGCTPVNPGPWSPACRPCFGDSDGSGASLPPRPLLCSVASVLDRSCFRGTAKPPSSFGCVSTCALAACPSEPSAVAAPGSCTNWSSGGGAGPLRAGVISARPPAPTAPNPGKAGACGAWRAPTTASKR
mmetsp:Transcript_26467/g.75194  ORF Transcript_26467/g.75194 Transcript_26467/m.75194 type:complete len:243 (+) Transcript_26467:214-942(+)